MELLNLAALAVDLNAHTLNLGPNAIDIRHGSALRNNLHIKTGQSLANFKSDGVDIAIRFGTGDWRGLRAIKLLDEELFPVCSPSLNGGRLPKGPRIDVIGAAADRP